MKSKYFILGVNTKTQKCCMLFTEMTFEEIKRLFADYPKAELSFRHSATNWSGCDDIHRTCEKSNVHPTGNKIKYYQKIHGVDYDHGHQDKWIFEYDEIWEVI